MKLKRLNDAATEKLVLDRVVKALETLGTLEVLRRGVKIAGGGTLILCQAVPEDDRNAAVLLRYRKNRLRVARARPTPLSWLCHELIRLRTPETRP
jgi:type I restriction enzyme, R subunit